MPRGKLTLEQRVQKARKHVNRIITKYTSRDLFLLQYNAYKRTKNPALKHVSNDYRYLITHEKQLDDTQKCFPKQLVHDHLLKIDYLPCLIKIKVIMLAEMKVQVQGQMQV